MFQNKIIKFQIRFIEVSTIKIKPLKTKKKKFKHIFKFFYNKR